MLKFIFFILFLVPLSFMKMGYWMVQNFLFWGCFLFMVSIMVVGGCETELSFLFGCSMLGYGLIILSFWICALMFKASSLVYKDQNYINLFVLNIVFLMLFLYLTFSTHSLLMFYIFFESSLIPTLFLILGWGYQPERLQAGLYLLFYTLLASLPLLISILYLYYAYGSLMFNYLLGGFDYMGFYVAMILAFLVKMPMFLVHLWLPKAHVEAPVAGSMILAGVLLKLGGYGLLSVFVYLQNFGMLYNYVWVSISLLGGFLVSLMCLRQTDLKSLIAYSSVAHMGIVLSGLLTLNSWGMSGAYTLMLGHGLCSSGLFCLANISYERLGSRSLLIVRGQLNFLPGITFWWFVLSAANMAAPPTLNLLGEISLINSLIGWSWLTILMLVFISFFSAAYSLYMYAYSQHGKLFSGLYAVDGAVNREFLLLFLHWFPLNLLILKSDYCLLWL